LIKTKVPNEIIEHCKKQITLFNFGQRDRGNGNKEQQLTGIISESVIRKSFGLDLIDGANGFDGGWDILFNGIKIDVKTMGRTTEVKYKYTNNFIKLQENHIADVYIFCSYNKISKELTMCGWIDKKTFQQKRKFYPKGSIRERFDKTTFEVIEDLYEIDNNELNDIQSFGDLKKQLLKFKHELTEQQEQ
jgi:hypothetical protein